jgi:acyl-CoA synthetase (AMP-forming)/AMP-acid ligase II
VRRPQGLTGRGSDSGSSRRAQFRFEHTAQANVVPESGGFDPVEIFRTIAHWPGTSMFAASTMVKRLIRHDAAADPTNLKSLIYGGGPMYVEDAQAALMRLGPRLGQIYGQGESPMTITCLDRETIADRPIRAGSNGSAPSACPFRTSRFWSAPWPTIPVRSAAPAKCWCAATR